MSDKYMASGKNATKTSGISLAMPGYLHRSGFFWIVVIIAFHATLFCCVPPLTAFVAPSIGMTIAPVCIAAYRLLFLVSVAIGAWRFGIKGGLLVCMMVAPAVLIKAFLNFEVPDSWIDLSAIGLGILFSGVAGRQGDVQKILEKRARELKQQSEILKKEIIERIHSEESLLLKNAMLEAQAEAAIDGILAVDKEQKILLHNKRLQEMWQIPGELLEGKSYGALSHIISQTKIPKLFQDRVECLNADQYKKNREETQLQDGRIIDVFTSPLVDVTGMYRGRIWYFRDISERKQMEQQLIMTDKLASIGELVSGIAHELNNPLTGVIGYAQLLLERNANDDIKEELATIASEAQRAARIVKDLLTFARKHTPVKQLCQINTVIEVVLRLRAYEQKVNNIEVVKNLADGLPEIMVDYYQMQQVFLNIIINAEFFMVEAHKRGRLTMTTEQIDGVVRISITDDGPGIPEKYLNLIFDPFFTTKDVGKGTGLGLSICHGIITEHGGHIHAVNNQNAGATFVIELNCEKEYIQPDTPDVQPVSEEPADHTYVPVLKNQ
jgi:PAS domain S-box-containing protein